MKVKKTKGSIYNRGAMNPFHIVIYSFSDSSNKEAMPIFAIESTSLQNNKGP